MSLRRNLTTKKPGGKKRSSIRFSQEVLKIPTAMASVILKELFQSWIISKALELMLSGLTQFTVLPMLIMVTTLVTMKIL